jgi:hypothetical protein
VTAPKTYNEQNYCKTSANVAIAELKHEMFGVIQPIDISLSQLVPRDPCIIYKLTLIPTIRVNN